MTREDHDEVIREEGFQAGWAAALRRAREEAERDETRRAGLLATVITPPQREVTTDIDRLVDERADLREQLAFAQAAARQYFRTLESVAAERDALKAQVEALTSSLDRAIWEGKGAPMQGEPTTPGASPFDGHPFVPMEGQSAVCATCGYAANPADPAKAIRAHPRTPGFAGDVP